MATEDSQYGQLPYEPRRSRQQQQQQPLSYERETSDSTNDELENVLNSVKAAGATARTYGESAAQSARTFGMSVFKQIQQKMKDLDMPSGNQSQGQQGSDLEPASGSSNQQSNARGPSASNLPHRSRYAQTGVGSDRAQTAQDDRQDLDAQGKLLTCGLRRELTSQMLQSILAGALAESH